MPFDDVTFPQFMTPDYHVELMFNTKIITSLSGSEQRFGYWSTFKRKFTFPMQGLSDSEMQSVRNFYINRKGSLNSFRFTNISDYQLTNEAQTNPYSGHAMQVYKAYSDGTDTYSRKIKCLKSGTVVVKENGSALTLTTHYTIDHHTGIITFVGAKPVNGAAYTVTAEFDIETRFEGGSSDIAQISSTHHDWASVVLIEVF